MWDFCEIEGMVNTRKATCFGRGKMHMPEKWVEVFRFLKRGSLQVSSKLMFDSV